MPLFVAVKNPFVGDMGIKRKLGNASQEAIDSFTQGLKDKGHDGVAMSLSDGTVELMAFDPSNVKSAIGNNGNFDGANPDISMSRGGQVGGMDFDALTTVVNRIKAKMPNMSKVHVLAGPAQAPEALKFYIQKQDAWDDVEGAMHNGELYMFASGLSDPLRAEHVLAEHEAAHLGLRAVLGDKVNATMQAIHRHGGRSGAWQLHRCASGQKVSP